MYANKIINNILGKPLKDGKSKNKETDYCNFCGSKSRKEGKFINYGGELAFICNDCSKYREETPDWNL